MGTKTNSTTTYHCDRCGKEIPSPYSGHGYHWELHEKEHWSHPHNGDDHVSTRKKVDLCNECGHLVDKFINTKVSNEFNAVDGITILVIKNQGTLF